MTSSKNDSVLCSGIAWTMTEAFSSASLADVVARMFGDKTNSEQCVGFLCARLMPFSTSSRRVRMTTSGAPKALSFRATRDAMAVPNDPEPNTQIFVLLLLVVVVLIIGSLKARKSDDDDITPSFKNIPYIFPIRKRAFV